MFGRKKEVLLEIEGEQYRVQKGGAVDLFPEIKLDSGDAWGTLHVTRALKIKVVGIK